MKTDYGLLRKDKFGSPGHPVSYCPIILVLPQENVLEIQPRDVQTSIRAPQETCLVGEDWGLGSHC